MIQTELADELGISVSERTVRYRVNEAGFRGRVARKKPLVKSVNRLKRLGYSSTYITKPKQLWDDVIWTDETKFNLFGSDGKTMTWRKLGEEFLVDCTVPTVAHSGGNVKVWECINRKEVGNLVFIEENMTGEMFKNILP